MLQGTGYRIESQVLLRDIVELEGDDNLGKQDKRSFNQQVVDFVILDEDSHAKFIVEFDGPDHSREKNEKADIRKNRFCTSANIPLLRVNDSFLEKHESYSALQFIVYRFIAWAAKWVELVAGFYKTINSMTPEEINEVTKDGFLDPGIDPAFIFDINHPVPETLEISNGLLQKYGIVTSFQPSETYISLDAPAYKLIEDQFSYIPSQKELLVEIKYSLLDILKKETVYSFSVKVGYSLSLTLDPGFDINTESPLEYKEKHGTWPISMKSIPWITEFELGEHMAAYIAHVRVLDWAKKNIGLPY